MKDIISKTNEAPSKKEEEEIYKKEEIYTRLHVTKKTACGRRKSNIKE